MSNQEVIDKIYELKSFAVKVQDYEMASKLRDIEYILVLDICSSAPTDFSVLSIFRMSSHHIYRIFALEKTIILNILKIDNLFAGSYFYISRNVKYFNLAIILLF